MLAFLAGGACRAPAKQPADLAAPAVATGAPFAWTLGTWRGQRIEAATGDAAPMTLTVRPILGGAGRLEELEVTHARGVYRGVHLILREVERERWVSHYANEAKGALVSMEGSAEGETFAWRSVAPARTRESRLVYERCGPDGWRRTQQFSEDGGQEWTVLFTDELIRTAK